MDLISEQRCMEINQIANEFLEDAEGAASCSSIMELAQSVGIRVIPYSNFPQNLKCVFEENGAKGIFYFDVNSSVFYILYNDLLDSQNQNFTVSIGVGHIQLDHFLTDVSKISREVLDEEAKIFGQKLLSTFMVLNKLNAVKEVKINETI